MQLDPCSSAMLGCLAITVCLQERGFICSLSVETVLWQNKSYNAKASLGLAVASHEPEPNVLEHERKVAWVMSRLSVAALPGRLVGKGPLDKTRR